MAVNLKVTGNGHFQGASTNLTDYNATEDATPIEGSDSSGGVGQITFGVIEDPTSEGTILLLNDTVELEDGSNGRTQGVVNGVSSTDGVASVSADARLVAFMATRTTQPYNGTLGGAFTYYLGLVGITTGFSIDSTITSRTVTFPGFTGNMWDYMKQMCIAQQVEIALVSSNIVLRPLRARTVEVRKNASESWAVQNSDLAQSVEVYYYNNKYLTNGLTYPQGGWNPDVSVYQVDANATLEFDIPTNVSLTSVQQPVVQDNVTRAYNASSVYAVAGNDGLPITAAQWSATGGSILVNINDDTSTLHVVIKGAADPTGKYAPYRIAVSSGPSDYYSSLRIVGTGVFTDKQLMTIPTGVPLSKTATVVGATVDNPFISTPAEAATVGLKTAQKWAMAAQTISATATVLNRKGDKGTANYPTFAGYFAPLYAGKTFAQFDTLNAGKTFGDWDAIALASVQDTFENQAFGNIAGARVKFRDAMYRIRTATVNASTIDYTAESDTMFSDFDARWTGKTFADFNTRFAGKTFQDFDVIPLYKIVNYLLNILATNLFTNPSFETGTAATIRTNFATNPTLESGATTGWTQWAGTTPGAVTTGVSTSGGAAYGSSFYRVTWTTTPGAPGGGGLIYDTGTTMSASTQYTISMYVRSSVAATVYPQTQLYNGATATTASTGATVTLVANVWTRISQTVTTGASDNHIQFRVYNNGTTFVAGTTFDGDAVLIEAAPDLRPYFDGSTTTLNLALNTRATATTSMFANSGLLHTVTKNVPITGHPQGITTAARSTFTAGHVPTASIASIYNMDGLIATNVARYLGVWVYSSLPNMKAYWFADGQALATPIPQQQWFFVAATNMTAGNTYASFGVLTQDVSIITDESAYVLVTGVVAQDGQTVDVFSDAALNDFTYQWTGTASASTSQQRGFSPNNSVMGNGVAIRSVVWSDTGTYSTRLFPTSPGASTTLIVAATSTGYQAQIQEGKTYTILATRRLFVPLTGVLATTSYLGRAALVTTNLGAFYSDQQLSNNQGTETLRWTFTVPVGAGTSTLRLGHGGPSGSGLVFWDSIMLIEGTYGGTYFDGNTTNTSTIQYTWTGTANASQSQMSEMIVVPE